MLQLLLFFIYLYSFYKELAISLLGSGVLYLYMCRVFWIAFRRRLSSLITFVDSYLSFTLLFGSPNAKAIMMLASEGLDTVNHCFLQVISALRQQWHSILWQ
jgi:hypothetical protein